MSEEEEMRRVWVERDDEKRTKNDHDEAFFLRWFWLCFRCSCCCACRRRRLLRFSTPLSSPLREEAGVYYSATITKIKFGIWMQVPEKDKTDTRDGWWIEKTGKMKRRRRKPRATATRTNGGCERMNRDLDKWCYDENGRGTRVLRNSSCNAKRGRRRDSNISKDGKTLQIRASSSTIKQELSFKKPEVLKQINKFKKCQKVAQLRIL